MEWVKFFGSEDVSDDAAIITLPPYTLMRDVTVIGEVRFRLSHGCVVSGCSLEKAEFFYQAGTPLVTRPLVTGCRIGAQWVER